MILSQDIEASVNEFLKNLRNNLYQNISKCHSEYNNEYDFPELDPLRYGIASCIICGYYQAAITLTNHLLENALKTFLIYHDVLTIHANSEKYFYQKIATGIDKYDGQKLNNTIDIAFTKKLISSEEKIELHNFREDYRNAYSHASKKKIFKDETLGISEIEVKEGQILVNDKIEQIIHILPFQGILQSKYAEANCVGYFKYVDRLVRKILLRLDELKDKKFAGT
jgi:hypothetical protein